MDTTYITILATVPFINTMALFAMVMLVAGSIGALVLNSLDNTPSYYSCPQELTYPRVLPNEAWLNLVENLIAGTEPEPYVDAPSIERLEIMFYDYSMDQLEEALEVVGLLAKVQKQENVVEWVYNAPAPVVENHWAHLKEVMNEVPFMGYIGDGRLDTIMLGGLKTPVFSWASL